jgi:hypothetical protein
VGQTSPQASRSPILKRKQAGTRANRIDIVDAAKISKMVLLAPDIVEAIVEGRTDDRVMLKVLEGTLPVDWDEQREALGI